MKRLHLLFVTFLIAAGGLSWLVAAAPVRGSPKAERVTAPSQEASRLLREPDYLSEVARVFLHQKMQRHGKEMEQLIRAVILLRYPLVDENATAIASEPILARPIAGGEDDLNAALPERFFVLQGELRARARALANAARARDDSQLGQVFGQMTESSVECHSVHTRKPNNP